MNADLVLIGFLAAAAFNVLRRERLPAIALLITMDLVHRAVFADADSAMVYYLSAATIDAVVAVSLYYARSISPFYFRMAEVCAVRMLVNLAGYFLYLSYIPPLYYNSAIIFTAIFQAIIMVFNDDFWRRAGVACMALRHAMGRRAGGVGRKRPETMH